jgi:hypothetical protein
MKSHSKVIHPKHFIKEKTGLDKVNHKVAKGLGTVLGNMYFFYFCVILDLAELPSVLKANSVIIYIAYVSQTVIQLLALPILQVYQNLQQEQNNAKADSDHQTLTYLATIQDEQLEILKKLDRKK